jgi:TfoX/Sxy family transcriptional regulator of competence genes
VPWEKSPPELVAAFEKARPTTPDVQARPMFGYPSVFVNGNHFAGTFRDTIVVRVGADPSFPGAKAAAPFEPMPGRVMSGYVVVPNAITKSPAKLRGWIAHAYDYAKTLPPKGAPKSAATSRTNPARGRAGAKRSAAPSRARTRASRPR